MVKSILLLIVAVATLAACASPYVPLTRYGTTATIETLDRTFPAELIAMKGDSLVVLSDSLQVLPDRTVRSVRLDIKQNSGLWKTHVVLTEVLPTAYAVVAAVRGNEDAVEWAIGGTLVSGLTIVAFLGTEPREYFDWPPPASTVAELMPYFRHPYGLTPEQLERLRTGIRFEGPKR